MLTVVAVDVAVSAVVTITKKQIDEILVLKGTSLYFQGNHVHKSDHSLYMDVANIVISPFILILGLGYALLVLEKHSPLVQIYLHSQLSSMVYSHNLTTISERATCLIA